MSLAQLSRTSLANGLTFNVTVLECYWDMRSKDGQCNYQELRAGFCYSFITVEINEINPNQYLNKLAQLGW